MTLRKPSSSHHVWLRRSYIWLSTGMGPSPRTNAERSNRIRPPPPLASAARRYSDVPPHIRGAPPHLACDLPLSWLGSAPLLARCSRLGEDALAISAAATSLKRDATRCPTPSNTVSVAFGIFSAACLLWSRGTISSLSPCQRCTGAWIS